MSDLRPLSADVRRAFFYQTVYRSISMYGSSILVREDAPESETLLLIRQESIVRKRTLPKDFVPFSPSAAHELLLGIIDPEGNERGALTVVTFEGEYRSTDGFFSQCALRDSSIATQASVALIAVADGPSVDLYRFPISPSDLPVSSPTARHITRIDSGIDEMILTPDGAFAALATRSETGDSVISVIDVREGQEGREILSRSEEGVNYSFIGFTEVDQKQVIRLKRTSGDLPDLVDVNLSDGDEAVFSLPHEENVDWYGLDADGERTLLNRWAEAEATSWIHSREGGLRQIPTPDGAVSSLYLEGNLALGSQSSTTLQSSVYLVDIEAEQVTTICSDGTENLSEVSMVNRRIMHEDGSGFQYWSCRPEKNTGFVLVDIHGGPEYVVLNSYDPSVAAWIAAGATWYAPNYHGSILFGEEFTRSIHGHPGELELKDIRSLVEHAREENRPDTRVILRGYSYGGMLALLGAMEWGADMIAGVIAGIPVLDWNDLWEKGAEDFRGYMKVLLGGTPQSVPEVYRRASPMTSIDRLTTPTLLIAAEGDIRCPVSIAEEFVRRGRERGAPIESKILDGGHESIFRDVEGQLGIFDLEYDFVRRVLSGD